MLKRITSTVGILLVLVVSVWGQVPSRMLELSLAGSLQVFTDENQTQYIVNIPVRAGYFLTNALEVEAEIAFNAPEDGEIGYIISGLLSYNFSFLTGIRPFALAGYGYTNSYPIITNNVIAGSEGLSLGVLNAGAGVKVPIGSKAALRTEYRFQSFTGEQDIGPISVDTDFQIHSLFAGFSIFLP